VRRARPNTVRIVGGRWRSRILVFPDIAGLRPTPDRVRETLFNWLGQRLDGKTCLDLFAGSGALGFEASSRGAQSVVMVEKDAKAIRSLRENARLLGADNIGLVHGDALEFLREARSRFDVVFVDAPYRLSLAGKVLELVPRALAPEGRVYLEDDAVLEPPPDWLVLRRGRAGQVHFHLLGRQGDDQSGLPGNV
jgi:16S rRNA (guanine(966)-N(2))-methyltransferase RsmD